MFPPSSAARRPRFFKPLPGRTWCSSNPRDLLGVKVRAIENAFAFVTIAPLFVGERVHGEVQKAVEFQLVPEQLPRARHGPEWRGRLGCGGLEGGGTDRCHPNDSFQPLAHHETGRSAVATVSVSSRSRNDCTTGGKERFA